MDSLKCLFERSWVLSTFTKAGKYNFQRGLVSWNLTIMMILLNKESKLLLVCWQFLMLDFYISTHGRKWNNKGQWLKVECITIQIRDGNVVLKSECSSLVADFQGKRWILRMSSRTYILLGKKQPTCQTTSSTKLLDGFLCSINTEDQAKS